MPPRPKRLKVNDDGSLELPLVARILEGATERTAQDAVVLPEPSMVELARIHDLVRGADKALEDLTKALPEVSPALEARVAAARANPARAGDLTEDDRAVLRERAEVLRDRSRVAYSVESPHGLALIAVVELLTGRLIEPADLPGWAMHWTVIGEVLARFMDPFSGRAAEMVEEAAAAVGINDA